MSNNDHDLSKLWQSQNISQIDMAELKRQWKTTRIKQFCYMAIDFGALIALVLILYFLPRKLVGFEMITMALVFSLLVVWVVYFVWLRRYSLGFVSVQGSTTDYIELIKTQYRQNIKIARLNKIASYLLPFIFVTFFSIAYWGELIEPEVVIRKLKALAIVLVIFMPINWIWAHKREQKFIKILAEFKAKF